MPNDKLTNTPPLLSDTKYDAAILTTSTFSVAFRFTLAIPLIFLLLTTAGCSGCNSKSPQTQAEQDAAKAEEERKKKFAEQEKKKENQLEVKPLRTLLGQELLLDIEQDSSTKKITNSKLLIKPGHWTATVQEMKANYNDFVGRSTNLLVNTKLQPTPIEHTNFTFQTTRPIALPKGQVKRIESELFVPDQRKIQLRSQLTSRSAGALPLTEQPLLKRMPSYQYFMVVMSDEISKYGFLKVTESVRMPWEEEFDTVSQPHYQVVLADAQEDLPLPSNPLAWSSIAYLVWDDVDPIRLSSQQQQALIDWLHWGGRLIINGPDSLDTLRASFLEDYLPAENVGQRSITAADLDAWSAYWSRRDRGQRPPALKPTKPWSAIKLKPKANATELVGRAGLFYECTVGRGSVVLSAIQLAERDFINWPGYDSFLNAALLRRPSRIFYKPVAESPIVDWLDYKNRRHDAHFTTGLRLFARDAFTQANFQTIEETSQNNFGFNNVITKTQVDRTGGLGSWSNFNPVSEAAREVLTEAAAVRVPGAGFVIGCLAVYLLALVPLNWMVFRALDRVEWAWIAAPVIAILGTILIVRQAQLDIGFVRSQTEVALLELHGDHQRGLLSRFTAFYSSLSTTYDVTFDGSTAIATPFPAAKDVVADEKIWDVALEKQKKVRLSGLAVSSASTKMLHSEEVYSLAGALQLGTSSRGQEQIENHSGYNLRDVVVVERYFDDDDYERNRPAKYRSCWIGELRDGQTGVIGFQPFVPSEDRIPHSKERQQEATSYRESKINVAGLLKLALQFYDDQDPLQQRRSERRVVGLIDQVLPGTEISPAASQIVGTTVVLAHLNYGSLPRPTPDINSPSDVLPETKTFSINNRRSTTNSFP